MNIIFLTLLTDVAEDMFIIITIPIIPLFCVVWPKHMTAIFSFQVVWFVIVPVGENLYNGTNDRSQTKLCLNRNTWTPIHLTELEVYIVPNKNAKFSSLHIYIWHLKIDFCHV